MRKTAGRRRYPRPVARKNIPASGFADDDGTCDPRLAAALAAFAEDPAAEERVIAALPGARLLVPVVAVLGEAETGQDGLRREKSSDMAVPTIQAPDGRRALPAFTSVAALARWRADARPVAVPLGQALRAMAHEGADTLLVDMAGPIPYELSGPALHALAAGRDRLDPLTDPLVGRAVREVVAEQAQVVRAYLTPATGAGSGAGRPSDGGAARVDGTVCLVLAAGAEVGEVAGRVANGLAGHRELRARLVHGLDLAVLPPEIPVPVEPLYVR